MKVNLLQYNMPEIKVKRALLVKERQRVLDTGLMVILNTRERNMCVNIIDVTSMVVHHVTLETEKLPRMTINQWPKDIEKHYSKRKDCKTLATLY